MPRFGSSVLLVLIAVGAAIATVWVYCPDGSSVVGTPGATRAWQRWCALSPPERLAYVRRYESVASRPDAAEVWRRCRAFGALSPTERQRQREVRAALTELLDAQSPAERRALLLLHERARAERLFRLLEQESPERLRALRERLQEHQ